MPPTVNGYTEDVTQYDYDPEKAKQLLQEAGADGATIEFNYPTGRQPAVHAAARGHLQRDPHPARGGRA